MSRLRTAAALVTGSLLLGLGLTGSPVAAAVTPGPAPQAAPIQGVDSMWVWQSHPAADLAATAQALGVRRVFLFVGRSTPPGDANLKKSVRLLHQEHIAVFALSGEPAWTFRHRPALAWAHRALALARFDGLHLDVEPHALPHWRHNQQALVADYLALLDKMAPLRGQLEVDAQFAYGRITTPDGTFADDILARVDGVTVMSYRDTAFGNNSMSEIATDWLQRATTADKPVWLGAETNPESDCPYCTFYEEGQARMAEMLSQVDAWAEPRYPTYQGIAVEDLDGWLALKP